MHIDGTGIVIFPEKTQILIPYLKETFPAFNDVYTVNFR
jgi:hypothetical protein